MDFKQYQHMERFGTDEVRGIELGECLVFYKIDGTNASVWLDNGVIKAGSRTRELTLENDNAGFYNHIISDENIQRYLAEHPNHRLYGEWLVPHSLKTYREDAWRRFYIFDVCLDKSDGEVEYLSYDTYKHFLDAHELDYIPPLARIKNATYESLVNLLDKTGQFLVQDGKGMGEGIVIKNYNWYNRFGRQVWAKIVATEFKEKHHKAMGCPVIQPAELTEEKLVNEFCTNTLIEKEYQKIVNENDGWRSQYIPQLFGKVFYELIREESWNMVKKHKFPTINFKTLNMMVINKIKDSKRELFS